MKKSLLAVAAMTAFAGAAQAQSSVTVYGILDVGYIGGNAKSTTVNATNGVVTPQETVSLLGQSAQTTSRLGFRGTEDLGGGLSALFTFETGLQPNQSTLSSFNNRQAFIGLAQKGMGNARIGTQYTPIHEAVAVTGANQQNNMVGDVIYPQNTGLTNRDGSSSNANAGYTVRANNMLRFESETIAGFAAKAFYVQNGRDENQTTYTSQNSSSATAAARYTGGLGYTGGNTNSTGYGLGLNYTFQKLLVSVNYQAFKVENPWISSNALVPVGSTTTTGANTNTIAGQTGVLTNMKDQQMYAGATYDFGILKAYAQYVNRKETSDFNSTWFAKRTGQQIGVRSYVTPTVEVFASGGMGRYTHFGASNPTANFTGYQLGANYWLSKRTNLYTIFGAHNTSTVSATNIRASSGAAETTARNMSNNANNYAVGVRHTF